MSSECAPRKRSLFAFSRLRCSTILSPAHNSHSGIPYLPGSVPGCMKIVQVLLFLKRIHAGPKTLMGIGDELPFGDQAVIRLLDQILAFLDVIENLAAKGKKTAVNQ